MRFISDFTTGAHRALVDVHAMKEVFTHPSLVECLGSLDIRPPEKQLKLWTEQKLAHQQTSSLTASLGLTAMQARKLVTLGISYEVLMNIRKESTDLKDFCQTLKSKRVSSDALLEKLVKVFWNS